MSVQKIITVSEARKLALRPQGLLYGNPLFGRGKKGVLKAIEHLGYIQIDAISVIQRAHHHTLWSRIPGYQAQYLFSLLSKDRKIFEYWSHAASFLPMTYYRYYLPLMNTISSKGLHWYNLDDQLKERVLDKIIKEGPLYARDFETPKVKANAMWNWKPAKKALHELFMEGKISVISRDGFQRRYDLTERFLPDEINTALPTQHEYLWFFIRQYLAANGLGKLSEICYQKIFNQKQLYPIVKEKIREKQLIRLAVKNRSGDYYALPVTMEESPRRFHHQIHFLSPFDNAIIQRKRVSELFDFNYQTEIYYPVHKRVYGYFSLPILYGTTFIGRMDPKANRKERVLEINNLQIEHGVKLHKVLVERFRRKLWEFALFNHCDDIHIKHCQPAWLNTQLA